MTISAKSRLDEDELNRMLEIAMKEHMPKCEKCYKAWLENVSDMIAHYHKVEGV